MVAVLQLVLGLLRFGIADIQSFADLEKDESDNNNAPGEHVDAQ